MIKHLVRLLYKRQNIARSEGDRGNWVYKLLSELNLVYPQRTKRHLLLKAARIPRLQNAEPARKSSMVTIHTIISKLDLGFNLNAGQSNSLCFVSNPFFKATLKRNLFFMHNAIWNNRRAKWQQQGIWQHVLSKAIVHPRSAHPQLAQAPLTPLS